LNVITFAVISLYILYYYILSFSGRQGSAFPTIAYYKLTDKPEFKTTATSGTEETTFANSKPDYGSGNLPSTKSENYSQQT